MIICIDCTAETKEQLDELLRLGGYATYSSAINVAVQNALVLQREVSPGGEIVSINSNPKLLANLKQGQRDRSSKPATSTQAEHARNVPEMFRSLEITVTTPILSKAPFDMWAVSQDVPLDRWIFGQHNKLLPAKASCRGIAFFSKSAAHKKTLQEICQSISSEAVALGDYLASLDMELGLNRDNAFSTAFPTSGEGAEKSCRRFASQFVCSVNMDGKASGLLIDLKLANATGKKKENLRLTDAGWRFAKLSSPLLDDNNLLPAHDRFSTDERQFLIDHVHSSVPVEASAYRTILRAIRSGADTPKSMDAFLRESVSPENEKLSDSFLSSQRSGAISRMEDVGLISRVRDGIRFSYAIEQLGESYLHRTSK